LVNILAETKLILNPEIGLNFRFL